MGILFQLLTLLHHKHERRNDLYIKIRYHNIYLIKALLVLDAIIFAILSEYQFDQVFVKFFLTSSPLRISPNDSLIFHVTDCWFYFLFILNEVGLTSAMSLWFTRTRLRIKFIELRVCTLHRCLLFWLVKSIWKMIVKIVLTKTYRLTISHRSILEIKKLLNK